MSTNHNQAHPGAGIDEGPSPGGSGYREPQSIGEIAREPEGIRRFASLREDALGTAHHRARCEWCAATLVIGEYEGLRCWVCPRHWDRQVAHAVVVQGKKGSRTAVHVPLPSQVLLYACPARHVLWGGQAGPGKSYGVRWWLYSRRLRVPGSQALLLRENWDQLEATHLRAMEREVVPLGARFYRSDRKAVFGKGSEESILDCGHMAETDAVTRYLSTEYLDIVADEASLYPVDAAGNTPLAELGTRARQVCVDRDGQTVEPRDVKVTNPGGPSASYLRDMHIDHTPDYERYPALKGKYDPADWAYLPARLDDNPYLDPEYEDTLAVLNKTRYEQLRHGDWSVFFGQFFSEWTPSLHIADATIAR